MIAKDIVDAWAKIRKIDNTIPDEILNFMKDAAIEKLKTPRNFPLASTVWRTARELEFVGFANWWKKRFDNRTNKYITNADDQP